MKFWRSSSKGSMGLMQGKKNKKSSSCMKTFFQFFAKGTFIAPKKKFLPPPIQSPHKPVVEKPIQEPILVEEEIDDLRATSTATPRMLKKSHSIVTKLMGLDLPDQTTPKLVLDSSQNNPSGFPSPEPANNTLQIIQDKHSQPLPPNLKDEATLLPPGPAKSATSGLVQNTASLASKPSHPNQQNLEQIDTELYVTRPVKSPPTSASPVNNEKILQATARLLDIGSQTIKSAGLKLQDPVIVKFGSKLNHELTDLESLKTTGTDSKAKLNEQVTVGGKETCIKRDILLKNAVSTAEIIKDAQKGSNRRDVQGNISEKMSPKPNKIKQNRAPVNKVQKDFIALNRSMIKTTPLRTKSKALERKQENKNPVRKVRQTDLNNRSGDAKIRKAQSANVKRGAKEMLISKGAGLVSEKPRDLKSYAKKEEDMCIVSFTFSAPMKHSNRYTSSSESEGRTDSGLTESSMSSSVLLDDGTSYSDTRIIPTTIYQGPSISDEFVSRRPNGLSDTKLDADKIETSLKQTKDENLMNETKISPTNTINKTSNKRSSEISCRDRSIKNRQHKTAYGSPKIELLMQNFINSKNCEDQGSSFLRETTKSVLKALSKVPNSCKEVDQLTEMINDFVTEHLYMVQSRLLNCGYNSWRNLKAFYTKEKIEREIEKEIVELERSVGKKMEVLIGKDMENWMDSRVNFEIGIQIEKEIISQLIGEVVRDFLT